MKPLVECQLKTDDTEIVQRPKDADVLVTNNRKKARAYNCFGGKVVIQMRLFSTDETSNKGQARYLFLSAERQGFGIFSEAMSFVNNHFSNLAAHEDSLATSH